MFTICFINFCHDKFLARKRHHYEFLMKENCIEIFKNITNVKIWKDWSIEYIMYGQYQY